MDTSADAIDPHDYIFKPVQSLTPAQRQAVLRSAVNKFRSIVHSDEHSTFMSICTYPMSETELEVFGDHMLQSMRGSSLKMRVYWNPVVAQADTGYSQFYNSYWNVGKRGSTNLSAKRLTGLDDRALYEHLVESDILLWRAENPSYDQRRQLLSLDIPVQSMSDLIFRPFSMMGQSLNCCFFDRLPNLKAICLRYTDSDGHLVGHGVFTIRFWREWAAAGTYPLGLLKTQLDQEEELWRRHEAHLLSEDEYNRQWDVTHNHYERLIDQHYQNKWAELFPYIEEFKLSRNLPLTTPQ